MKALMIAATALLALTASSQAAVVLTFEGGGNTASINNFYNGGTDSQGNSGTDFGVQFSTNGLSLIGGNFEGNPSGDTIAYFTTGPNVVMNVAAGFTTGFSFFYSSVHTGTVNVFDGIDGTGSLLASIPILANFDDHCAPGATTDFCSWDQTGAGFTGIARSVVFGGTETGTGYDNVTLGSAIAEVPEPASWLLVTAGLAGLGLTHRRGRVGRRSTACST
jgi:hypothetical protein